MSRSENLLRQFRQVVAAGRRLKTQGWVAAALDVERKWNLKSCGYPGSLVQSVFISAGRRFAAMTLRPTPHVPPGALRRRPSRQVQAEVHQTLHGLGYGHLRNNPRGPGFVRILHGTTAVDTDWTRVQKACLRAAQVGQEPRAAPPPRVISRILRSDEATDHEIW